MISTMQFYLKTPKSERIKTYFTLKHSDMFYIENNCFFLRQFHINNSFQLLERKKTNTSWYILDFILAFEINYFVCKIMFFIKD